MKGIIGNGAAIAAISVVMAAAVGAQAVDANAGRDIAAGCANCHGTNGVSSGTMPSLAGVAKAQLVNRMLEFKSGKRPGTIMPQLAKGYTDEQINLVGGWFARQPASIK
jgi:sulfide dehydrogenase cytochrome subunit